jgi:hypothetical protein
VRTKKLFVVLIIMVLCAVLSEAATISETSRLQVWRIAKSLPKLPVYARVLQYSDLSRMEFAVVLGRLIEDHPHLKYSLKDIIQSMSWELSKLGYNL